MIQEKNVGVQAKSGMGDAHPETIVIESAEIWRRQNMEDALDTYIQSASAICIYPTHENYCYNECKNTRTYISNYCKNTRIFIHFFLIN